jgi:uncharacterized membrane protein YdfJ with MMPL/SSD domain
VMAFAMALGILLDTFLVRSLLVPALVIVFGRAGLWPRHSDEYHSKDVSDRAAAPLQRQSQGGGDAYDDARDHGLRTTRRRP